MERQPEYPPEFDDETPCLICGRDCDDCPCPECPECGEKGKPECQGAHGERHGLVWPLRVCPTCKGQKVSMPDPQYGGDPMVCPQCNGKGELLFAFPVHKRLGEPLRMMTKEEREYCTAAERVRLLWDKLAANYCVRCMGHGHILKDCPTLVGPGDHA